MTAATWSRRGLLALAAAALAGCATSAGPPDLTRGTVLVAGGSGRAGRVLLQELASRGIPFRATTRNLAEARGRLGADAAAVDWVEADLRDAAAARAAVRGADYVISVIGSREMSGANSAEFVDYGAVRNLVDAARAEGVRHVVLLSAIGVTDPASPANKLFKGALQWRLKGEDYLAASGLRYTVVRPGGLVDRPAGVQGVRIAQGDDWRAFAGTVITRGDLARVLVECLRVAGARNARLELANDAQLPLDGWLAQLDELMPDA